MDWHIGCSGFHYKHWKETFYSKGLAQRKWFNYYAEQFKTLELNVTFYRFPQLSFLKNWHAASPPDFSFAVKAPRIITHFKQFHQSKELLSSFYDTINNGLDTKLGPVLFQMPPRFTYSEDKLERILANLEPSFLNVVEFRHASWWQESVYKRLATKNITFCSMSFPGLPQQLVANTPLIYYRFHGVPDLYHSLYSKQQLAAIATEMEQIKSLKETWIYFNNDIEAHAPINAHELIDIISDKNL